MADTEEIQALLHQLLGLLTKTNTPPVEHIMRWKDGTEATYRLVEPEPDGS